MGVMVHTDANSRDLDPPWRQRSTRGFLGEAEGGDSWMGQTPGLRTSTYPSLLPDCRWNVASCLRLLLHAFPTTVDCTLKLWVKITRPSLNCLNYVFCHNDSNTIAVVAHAYNPRTLKAEAGRL